ncbi:MAG: YtxH domain-containing protein [Rhodoglobus sp.]
MKGKILLVVGLGIGYVLGARAGREKYDKIAAVADKLWNSPPVKKKVATVEDFVKEKSPDVAEFVADGAKKVVTQLLGSRSSGRQSEGRATSASDSK